MDNFAFMFLNAKQILLDEEYITLYSVERCCFCGSNDIKQTTTKNINELLDYLELETDFKRELIKLDILSCLKYNKFSDGEIFYCDECKTVLKVNDIIWYNNKPLIENTYKQLHILNENNEFLICPYCGDRNLIEINLYKKFKETKCLKCNKLIPTWKEYLINLNEDDI